MIESEESLSHDFSCHITTELPGSLKLFQNFHGKTHPIFLKSVDLCLEISDDFNYNSGFVVDEIFELGHTRKSQCFDTFGSLTPM